ncbi:hypothetical protein TPHA_0D02570 [Tetrapisispora phaffii CBS 4417]|uniref:Mediator of RNA polymerase II transcription subunit 13 n=1 Tax=Tetrapisispora phaffii (strain ATCC 24235 / CBS 4417 / NBRC 1672 / NRRL Y-8282 / UCD 70-5) TaxID=1071381 RepID=G8BSS3_TETPH|nr:hypothetical protein TPHA_0D02570 [Tetrapisispora phaffii CBS 4417]CCE62894.1 hypothetical protein TPHA_0D02570 [Tetrapisispora phaffii CBS 4417]
MSTEEVSYRLEDVLTNFYKIEKIEKINYAQYTCKNRDDQWALKTEMILRKNDPKCLIASLSRELWCFSMNDDPLPIIHSTASDTLNNTKQKNNSGNSNDTDNLTLDLTNTKVPSTTDDTIVHPDKSDVFDANYSKPNLPPSYAIFLKALRRMIYLNLTSKSNRNLLPIGNGCIISYFDYNKENKYMPKSLINIDDENLRSKTYLHNKSDRTVKTYILQIEPHLFENGDLTLSLSLKHSDLLPLNIGSIPPANDQNGFIHKSFVKENAIYILPSGTRAYLPSLQLKDCLTTQPENSEVLLKTLAISHGVDLLERKKEIEWIKIIPNLTNFNGQLPTIASFNKPSDDTRTISWPLDLIYIQPASNNKSASPLHETYSNSQSAKLEGNKTKSQQCNNTSSGSNNNSSNIFPSDLDDAFNIIDNYIQLRQSSAYRTPGIFGALSTNNPSSSGGAYTDQFQIFNRSTASNSNSVSIATANAHSTSEMNPRSAQPFSTTNSYSNIDMKFTPTLDQTLVNKTAPVTSQPGKIIRSLSENPIAAKSTSSIDMLTNEGTDNKIRDVIEQPPFSSKESSNFESVSIDSVEDKELFGEDYEDFENEENNNSFNETRTVSDKPNKTRNASDEITEDMFEMSDDEEGENTNSRNRMFTNSLESDNKRFFKENIEKIQRDPTKRSTLKRQYLDIPLEEITLSNSPLYMDPGAPLPVETPRERRKSVFAPLNFNPIIESNVDNKYKSGGKFSFEPSQSEEALNFDISKNSISESGDDSDGSDDLEDLEYKGEDKNEFNTIDLNFPITNGTMHDLQGQLSSGLVKNDQISSTFPNTNEDTKYAINSIWRSPPSDGLNVNSPVRMNEPQASYIYPESKMAIDIFPKFSLQQNRTKDRKPLDKNSNDEVFPESLKNTSPSRVINESKNSNYEFATSSIASLPFLFRHMPISSIPEEYTTSNPIVKLNSPKQDILNLIAEQIIFDWDKLDNLHYPDKSYIGVTSCSDGLIKSTVSDLFTSFERVNGNILIEKMYKTQSPSIYLKRRNEIIKIRADCQPFSKYLNLKPVNAIKNFKLLLLTTSNKLDCPAFVSSLCQTYISHEFGFCERLKLNNEDTEGMVYLDDYQDSRLLLLATQLVAYCLTTQNSSRAIPILLIFPLKSNSLSDLVLMTSKFQIIYDEVKAKIPNAELYFKTVLMDFIKDPLTLIDDYHDLSVSIYNNLPKKSVKFTSIVPKHPDKIKFRTSQSNNIPSAIHYDTYIHLAYSRSIDKEWIFAAFSDSFGKDTSTRVWYVGRSKTKFDQACTEIWANALKLASTKYGKICLILTRLNSILPDDELMNWRRLSGRNIHLAVVCVNDTSKISFVDEDQLYPTFKPSFKDDSFSTPINPHKLGDYELRDISQELYSIIFEYPFPLSNSQHRCAIKSGALVKFNQRRGSLLPKFEINLLNCPHSDSTQLLQTILSDFTNLAALNPWFGISKGEYSHIPWHVLAVKKMMKMMVHINVETE